MVAHGARAQRLEDVAVEVVTRHATRLHEQTKVLRELRIGTRGLVSSSYTGHFRGNMTACADAAKTEELRARARGAQGRRDTSEVVARVGAAAHESGVRTSFMYIMTFSRQR